MSAVMVAMYPVLRIAHGSWRRAGTDAGHREHCRKSCGGSAGIEAKAAGDHYVSYKDSTERAVTEARVQRTEHRLATAGHGTGLWSLQAGSEVKKISTRSKSAWAGQRNSKTPSQKKTKPPGKIKKKKSCSSIYNMLLCLHSWT